MFTWPAAARTHQSIVRLWMGVHPALASDSRVPRERTYCVAWRRGEEVHFCCHIYMEVWEIWVNASLPAHMKLQYHTQAHSPCSCGVGMGACLPEETPGLDWSTTASPHQGHGSTCPRTAAVRTKPAIFIWRICRSILTHGLTPHAVQAEIISRRDFITA